MHETFPIAVGIISALVVSRFVSMRLKLVALLACSAVFGAVASFLSGELLVSWVFLVVDSALVLLSAGVTIVFFGSGKVVFKSLREAGDKRL